MEKVKADKNKTLCVAAIVITVAAQAFEKIFSVATQPSQAKGLLSAMIYTVVVAVVYYLISKATSSFMGLLASLIAFKMAPPNINYLTTVSVDGAMLYFIVQKAAMVLFAVLVYKFYREQQKPRAIKPLPLLVIAVAVPFFNEIANYTCSYLYYKTGSMMMPYFAQYACYAAAVIITLVIAYISGKESMRFAAYFEFCALSINTCRQLGKIGYFAVTNQHISKSLYVWIVVLAGLMVVTAYLLNKSKKTLDK